MNKDVKPGQGKPKLRVPNTQISIAQNQSSTTYIIVCSVFMGLIVLVGGYFIWNLTNTFFDQSNRIKALEKQKSLLDKKEQNLQILSNGPLKEIQKKDGDKPSTAELIMNALPMTEDQKNLYAMMEAIATDSHVKMQDISINDTASSSSAALADTQSAGPGEPQKPKTVNYTVTIVGPYTLLLDFLANTEKSARVINFRKMTLEGDFREVKASIDFTTYYQDKANIDDHEEPLQ